MKQLTFKYQNREKFKTELNEFKKWHDNHGQPKIIFQIYSEILEKEIIMPVCCIIEEIFSDTPWYGCSTSGNIIDCNVADEITITATIFEYESSKFEMHHYSMNEYSIEQTAEKIVEESNKNTWIKSIEIYHTIPESSTTNFCKGLKNIREDIQISGGIVCSKDITSSASCIFSSEKGYCEHGILAIFYGGDDLYIETIKISGWKPIGRTFRVTKSTGSRLYELSGMPAYEIYHKYLNIGNDENFFYNALEFPMLYEHNGTTIVRAPAASNPDGSLSMSSDVENGSIIRLSYGEPGTILENIRQESHKIVRFQPDILHIFSCAARKAFWSSQEATYEIYPFKDIASSAGFFSHGEFLRENGYLNQHNITLVIAAMREGKAEECEIKQRDSRSITSARLPLASRMATFIRETSFELEEINSKLEVINQQLQEVATTDSLTGLENRLAFDSLLKAISNDSNEERDWVMVMLDLNGLKFTNDTFGHHAGDALIKAAAEAVKTAYGKFGSCFRIGGDEFVVIIDASREMMRQLHSKMDEFIENYNRNFIYHLSIARGESRLKTSLGIKRSISDWKLDADIDMYRNKAKSRESRDSGNKLDLKELISCVISIEEAKDPYTAHHSDRVKELSITLAQALGLSDRTIQLVADAAHLHDIGKIGISDAILTKPSRLTNEEYSIIKEHPVIGAKILMKANHTQEIVQIVMHHHERYDGKGYPDGLSGDEIPIGARIIAIADSIDAMCSKRCYRNALSLNVCYEEIKKNLGIMYDPAIGKVALENWDKIEKVLFIHPKELIEQ